MKKRIWLIVAGLVLLGLVATGVFFGPRLYVRLFAPVTPMGRMTGVETIESFGPGGPGDIRAVAGYQLWVVHFQPVPGAKSTGPSPTGSDWLGKAYLLDEIGEKHSAAIVQEQFEGETQSVTARALVFSIPQGRKPHSIQFGDATPVRLPMRVPGLSPKPN